MSAERLLLFWLLLMCCVVGLALTTPEPAGGHGVPHGDSVAMLQGSPTPPSDRILMLGWLFGLTQVGFFVTCMTLGITRTTSQGRGVLLLLFAVGTLLYAGAMTMMVLADRAAVRSEQVAFIGWFPAATTWMLFGIWSAPLVFVLAYMIGFQRWIIPPVAMSRFEELVAANRKQTSTSPETAADRA